MKNTFLTKSLILMMSLAVVTSCSKKDEDPDTGGDGGGNAVSSITLEASSLQGNVGDVITFTVKTDTGEDVTSSSAITVSGTSISNASFTISSPCSFSAVASYNNLSSNTLSLTGNSTLPVARFKKNVLIEDFTGTWCGYCPRVSYATQLAKQQSTQVIDVGAHYSDEMSCQASTDLHNLKNITSWPTAYLNRKTLWAYPENNNVSQAINLTGNDGRMGLALSPSVNGNIISVDVELSFSGDYESFCNDNKIVVYVVEDGLIYDQSNYTTFYGGGSVIYDFEHNSVLRGAMTPVAGELITTNNGSKSFSTQIPSNIQNISNVRVVAFVINSSGKVQNVRAAGIGETQTLEVI
jgi:hypothetical protein